MSKVIVLNKPAGIEGPLPAVPLAQPVHEPNLSHACLVDCVEDAMNAIAVRVHLLRRHGQRVSENSPWTWKQLTRIENRLEELQIALKSVRNRPS